MKTKENVFLEDVNRVFHPQVPGKWDKKCLGRFQNVNTGKFSTAYKYTCNRCGWSTGEQAKGFHFCPMCGAKMDAKRIIALIAVQRWMLEVHEACFSGSAG